MNMARLWMKYFKILKKIDSIELLTDKTTVIQLI